MSRSIKIIILVIVATLYSSKSFTQLDSCDVDVPYFYIDMTAKPDSVWMSPNISRSGQCCGESHPDQCISFEILIDSNTAGIQIDMIGADPAGSLFYDIDCEGAYPGGTIKCISGAGLQKITFCKPGNNKNIYIISAIAKPTFPNTDTTRIGCSKKITTFGLVDSTITWNSVFPSTPGAYNSYLSCIDCKAPIYTPDTNAPAYVDYEICGFPIADECGFILTVCDTVRIYNFDALEIDITPDSATFCDLGGGSGVDLTALPSGGDGDYTLIWRDSAGIQVGSGLNYFATFEGDFSLELFDGLISSTCPSVLLNFHVSKGLLPVVDAGDYDKVCASNPSIMLQGSISNANSVFWSGGSGIFSPDSASLTALYTPSASEISNGYVKLYLNSITPGCYSVIDSTIILFSDTLKVSLSDSMVSCFNDAITLIPTITGGTAPFTYLWSNGAITNSISVGEGAYFVQVTDSIGCTSSDMAVITSPIILGLAMSSTDATTNGGSDGTATASVSGGTPSYSYLWSPSGQITATATGLSYGVHSVVITDANGCTISSSVVVNEPRCAGLTSTISQENMLCFGDSIGSASVFPTGGVPPYSYLWSNGDTLATTNNLGAGVYTITVSDSNGCLDVNSVVITQPSKLNDFIIHSDVTIVSGNDGDATVIPSGGTAGYTYLWSTGETTASIDSLVVGTYSVTITDNNNCVRVDSVIINQPICDMFFIGIDKTDVSCFGAANGSASITVINGVPPYGISWSDGQTGMTATNLAGGSYSVSFSDSRGCSTFGSLSILEPQLLSIALAPTDMSCFGTSDGTIDATISGGTYPYSYSWSSGQTSQDIVSLGNGNYVLTVTDAHNCTAKDSSQINEPAALEVLYSVTPVTCNKGSDGAIDITVSGGVLPYSFDWSDGSTTEDISGLSSGGYTVLVSDANGCSISNPIIFGISEPDSLKIESSVASCPSPGEDSTYITLTPIGGNGGPYQISHDNGINYHPLGVYTFKLPTNATYIVWVKDTNLCISNTPDTISINSTILIDSISYDPCLATSSSNIITIFPNGGIGGLYEISTDNGLSFGAFGDYVKNLNTGSGYNIIVRDSLGCLSATDSIYIYDSLIANAFIASNYEGTSISCYGENDAIIATVVTGGKSPYSYIWNTGSTNDSLIGVGAGLYSVTVTDENGCSDTSSVIISQPDSISTSVSVISDYNGQDISCYGYSGGIAVASASGGNGAFQYLWSNGSTNDTLMNVTAGTYYVTITDANGCIASDSIIITQPDSISTNVSVISNYNGTDISCYGESDGMALVTSSGGTGTHSYLWSNGSTNDSLIGVGAGTYSVIITDINGCSTSDTIIITQPDSISSATSVISDYNEQDISCYGASDGMALVTSSGGTGIHQYLWSNGSTNDTLMNVGAGTYSVTITDANGCSAINSITISQPDPIATATSVISDYNGQDISCYGASDGIALVTSSGGTGIHQYLWSNGSTNDTLMNVAAGTYYVTVTDINGCSAIDSITISQPEDISTSTSVISNYNGQDISCYGVSDGSALVTSSGGTGTHQYIWSNGSNNDSLMNVSVGTYFVTVFDINGCSAVDSITLSQPDSISTTTSVISNYNGQDISCYGVSDGSALVTSSGGTGTHQYIWSNGSNSDSLMNVSVGTYSVTVFDVNGCSASNSITISQPDSISASFLIHNVSCNEGSDGAITSFVNGGTPGYTYQWSGPGLFTSALKDLTGISAGTYTVIITDTNGCLERRTNIVTEPTAIALFLEITPVRCYGGSDGSIDLLVSGGTPGYAYSWTSQSGYTFIDSTLQDQSILPAGTYTVTVTDFNSCIASITGVVTQPNPLLISSELNDAKCYDNSDGDIAVTTFGGIPPYSYVWSIGETTSSINNLSAGTYTVVITDSNNCRLRRTFVISEPDSLFMSLYSPLLSNGYNITYNNGNDGQIDATIIGGTLPYSFIWSNGASTEDLDNLKAGTYTLTVEDSNNCSIFFSIILTQPTHLRMPTGYTPNFDGSNDNFVILGIDAYPINSFTVYNRWGDVVYKQKDYNNTWRGQNMDGEQLPDATYFAILRIDREDITLKGYVDLRR